MYGGAEGINTCCVQILNMIAEGKESDRAWLLQLLSCLIRGEKIRPPHFEAPLTVRHTLSPIHPFASSKVARCPSHASRCSMCRPQELIPILSDVAIDVPHVYDNVAAVLPLLLRQGMVNYGWLQEMARRALPDEADFCK